MLILLSFNQFEIKRSVVLVKVLYSVLNSFEVIYFERPVPVLIICLVFDKKFIKIFFIAHQFNYYFSFGFFIKLNVLGVLFRLLLTNFSNSVVIMLVQTIGCYFIMFLHVFQRLDHNFSLIFRTILIIEKLRTVFNIIL